VAAGILPGGLPAQIEKPVKNGKETVKFLYDTTRAPDAPSKQWHLCASQIAVPIGDKK
jgi:hypothetical protein